MIISFFSSFFILFVDPFFSADAENDTHNTHLTHNEYE